MTTLTVAHADLATVLDAAIADGKHVTVNGATIHPLFHSVTTWGTGNTSITVKAKKGTGSHHIWVKPGGSVSVTIS